MNWRNHPVLKDKFHREYPDDTQAFLHEGFRAATVKPELVWIRVTGMNGNLVTAELLNQPVNLKSFHANENYTFQLNGSGKLIYVSPAYLEEIKDWKISPCEKCGNDVLFDTPATICRIAFPDMPEGAVMQVFTTFCPMCGNAMAVSQREFDDGATNTNKSGKKWYEFWK
jgi:hypothetical protein